MCLKVPHQGSEILKWLEAELALDSLRLVFFHMKIRHLVVNCYKVRAETAPKTMDRLDLYALARIMFMSPHLIVVQNCPALIAPEQGAYFHVQDPIQKML